MKQTTTRHIYELVCCGLLMAIGVLLPGVFHSVAGQSGGMVFLPMHIPVLIAGLYLGPVYGAVAGLLTPVISCLTTGMPLPAQLPFMALELAAYGVVAGLIYRHVKRNLYIALLAAQVGGRLVKAAVLFVAADLLRLPKVAGALSVWTATLTGWPGLLIQLLIIPPVVFALQKGVRAYDR